MIYTRKPLSMAREPDALSPSTSQIAKHLPIPNDIMTHHLKLPREPRAHLLDARRAQRSCNWPLRGIRLNFRRFTIGDTHF